MDLALFPLGITYRFPLKNLLQKYQTCSAFVPSLQCLVRLLSCLIESELGGDYLNMLNSSRVNPLKQASNYKVIKILKDICTFAFCHQFELPFFVSRYWSQKKFGPWRKKIHCCSEVSFVKSLGELEGWLDMFHEALKGRFDMFHEALDGWFDMYLEVLAKLGEHSMELWDQLVNKIIFQLCIPSYHVTLYKSSYYTRYSRKMYFHF